MTNREKLLQILRRTFPQMWTKYSEQFDGRTDAIWTGEGCYMANGDDMFNHSLDGGSYTMGVHNDLVAVLDKHNWFAEWADGGTVFIYKND